jgi:hypothetical protein
MINFKSPKIQEMLDAVFVQQELEDGSMLSHYVFTDNELAVFAYMIILWTREGGRI